MACDCKKVEKAKLWTPIPEFKKPTECCKGENIDCYSKRAGSNGKDDAGEKVKNTINNTSLTSDVKGNVNEQFKLTPGSDKNAVTWRISCNGKPGLPDGMGLNFNTSTGALTGKVDDKFANKQYKISVRAYSESSDEIDSREFNFYPKTPAAKDEVTKFVWPLSPKGTVTSTFGPRNRPLPTASSVHKGIDIANPRNKPGTILAAADGTVVKSGPASGFGNAIYIEHRDSKNNLVATTVYGHWDSSYVKVGQKVSAGQKIAKEGNAGVSTGNHLHFELHKGGLGNPVDPMGYLNGKVLVAENNNNDGTPKQDSFKEIEKKDQGMASGEAKAAEKDDCPPSPPNQAGDPGQPTGKAEPTEMPTSPNNKESQAEIQKALNEDSTLTDADKKLLTLMAKLESDFKPDAKNPTSSARGAFQMLDKTADKYYKKIGVQPTTENRNDPYLATKAQIQFYKDEQLKYWNEFNNSKATGKPTLAGKRLSPQLAEKYSTLSKGEFIYGLIHHDGVGNAVKGKDMQGVDYFRRKA